jgi:uncharacterized protein
LASIVSFVRTGDNPGVNDVAEAAVKIYDHANVAASINRNDYAAVKFHPGDRKNVTHVTPELIAALVSRIKEKEALPFMTETSTLYKGARENAVKHIMHAAEHGFTLEKTGAPFIMADGLAGDSEIEVQIDGELNKSVFVAREARMADFLLIVSHMTGHIGAGYGAALKNLGMGLASRKGKLRQHASINPRVINEKCVLCEKCMEWCPAEAIIGIEGKASIDSEKCIGCGECLAVCRIGAIESNFGRENDLMQQDIAEHALGVVKNKKCFYINVCVNMTKDCDCFAVCQEKIIPDVGVLGSWDPVALDQASVDLTVQPDGSDINKISYSHIDGTVQIRHAEKIGLGTRKYEIVEL